MQGVCRASWASLPCSRSAIACVSPSSGRCRNLEVSECAHQFGPMCARANKRNCASVELARLHGGTRFVVAHSLCVLAGFVRAARRRAFTASVTVEPCAHRLRSGQEAEKPRSFHITWYDKSACSRPPVISEERPSCWPTPCSRWSSTRASPARRGGRYEPCRLRT